MFLNFFLSDDVSKSWTEPEGRMRTHALDLLHLMFGGRKLGVHIRIVRLNRVRQSRIGPLGFQNLGGFDGVERVVLAHLPIQVVQKAHLAPELHVLGVMDLGVIAHETFERFAVLDMIRVFVVAF